MLNLEDHNASTSGQAWLALDVLDRQLFTQLAEVTETFGSRGHQIWGLGFRPDTLPLILARGLADNISYAYTLNVDAVYALDPNASRVQTPESLGLPAIYRISGAACVAFELTEEMPAQFAFDVAGQDCLVLSYTATEAHASSWEFARFLVHESFHHFQIFQAMWRTPVGFDPCLPRVGDPLDAAIAVREQWYLEAAVLQDSGQAAKQLASKFLDLRTRRHDRRPELEAIERGYEQIEGSARYVENAYARVNGRPMRLVVPAAEQVDHEDFATIGRHYRVGARAMELLDRFDQPWRHRFVEGEDPVALLATALRSSNMADLFAVADLRSGELGVLV